MASGEGVPRALSPTAGPDDSFPAAPPSIISSRMTDIMSDDGGDTEAHRAHGAHRRSAFYSDLSSRPGTARTAMSQRSPWTQGAPLRRGLSGKRGSVGSSSTAPRPGSSTTRSHVPSLTSHAFFRPMSSQKLQAQRGIARPTTMNRQFVSQDEVHDPNRNSVASGTGAQLVRESVEEAEMRGPPSRGTEFTELDTIDRRTANTSPVHGHQASSSLTDSVRPLQRKPADGRQLTLDMSKTYKTDANVPTPVRTPRSLRSAFLMPRGDSGGSNREMEGGEKLDSVASSPKLPPKGHGGEMSSKMEKTKQKAGHNYEYFQGNTVFCIGGRLQNTRHKPVNIATGSLVVIPGILFFIFSASWLWHNVSPAVPITFGYLYYICVSSFLHASASDPGILPRNLHRFPPPEENDDPWRPGPPTTEWTLIKSAERSTAAMEVPTKYCRTCQIWRPPRAHHCRLCDNCVETQDHHCVWLNNCVGRRNYRYFFTFISSATFLGLYLAGASLAQVLLYMHRTEGVSFGDSISKFRVPFAMVIYGFLAFLYPAALMGYHVFLMARGETTREYLNSHKFLKKDRYKAFTQGSWFKNWFVVLCRPRPPTYYGFKKSFTQGDQRFGSTRREKGSSGGGGSPHQPAKNAEGGGIETKEGMEMQNVKPSPQPQQQSPQQPETGFQGPRSLMRFSTGLGMSGAPEARGNT